MTGDKKNFSGLLIGMYYYVVGDILLYYQSLRLEERFPLRL